jgi:hypothetical protein
MNGDVDRLYQLPLEEFIAARNALAKDAGADAADIRKLQKPPVAAWGVNQLYWKKRRVYDALVDAAQELRAAHKALLGGKRGDLRGASKAHDEALEEALKATLDLLNQAGHKATDATKQAVLNTLRALPSTDPPGRLARTLQPGGFEMLAGFQISPTKSDPARTAAREERAETRKPKAAPARDARSAAAERRAAAREAAAQAARELREAETELKRQEFTAARAAKESERADLRLEQAREALAAAEREVEEAERAATAAGKARDRARREAEDAQVAVDTARARLEHAQRAVNEIRE